MSLNFMVLSPKDAIQFVFETLTNERTRLHRIMFHGEPGIGKSSIMRAVARMMNATLIDLRLSHFEGPDLRGLTLVDPTNGTTVHQRPEWLPEYTEDPDAPKIIIFLDEILSVHDGVRKSAFELILDHRIGPFPLGPNVTLVAAGNTAEDGTNIYEFDAATADRFCHVKIESTVEGFVEYGQDNGYHPSVLAFIQNHPECFLPSKEDHMNATVARPSPRSLERCSETLFRGYSKPLFRDTSLKGWLGNYSAGLLITDIDDEAARFDLHALIDAAPGNRKYPTSQFGIYNLAQSLASYADNPEKLDKAVEVMMALPDTTNCAVEECKTAFFFAIDRKLGEWKLLQKYARDQRIKPFLARLDEIIDEADQQHADQQSQELQQAA